MHIESDTSPLHHYTSSYHQHKFSTPSTDSPLCEDPSNKGVFSQNVSEFSLEAEMTQVTRMMGNVNLEEK